MKYLTIKSKTIHKTNQIDEFLFTTVIKLLESKGKKVSFPFGIWRLHRNMSGMLALHSNMLNVR